MLRGEERHGKSRAERVLVTKVYSKRRKGCQIAYMDTGCCRSVHSLDESQNVDFITKGHYHIKQLHHLKQCLTQVYVASCIN